MTRILHQGPFFDGKRRILLLLALVLFFLAATLLFLIIIPSFSYALPQYTITEGDGINKYRVIRDGTKDLLYHGSDVTTYDLGLSGFSEVLKSFTS